jgi:hypothetical protein
MKLKNICVLLFFLIILIAITVTLIFILWDVDMEALPSEGMN